METDNRIIAQFPSTLSRIRFGLAWEPIQQPSTFKKILRKKEGVAAMVIAAPFWLLALIAYYIKLGFTFILRLKAKKIDHEIPDERYEYAKFPELHHYRFDLAYDNTDRSKHRDDLHTREYLYEEYDLDLYCMAVNYEEDVIVKVCGETKYMIDPHQVMFHSGDDNTGQGIDDDEDVSVMLNIASDVYDEFVVLITSDNKHDFGSLDNKPKLRLVNATDETNIFKYEIPTHLPSAKGAYGFLAFKCMRTKDSTWNIHLIEKFMEFQPDWLEYFRKSDYYSQKVA